MGLGVVLAFFYRRSLWTRASLLTLVLAVLAANVIASSNYVLNELIDAPSDRRHPVKRSRPAAAGMIRPVAALVEWIVLGAVGLGLAFLINPYFGLAGLGLWLMGLVYNVPPIRTKEIPYVDVLSESINNPLRLFLGWFALIVDKVPPISGPRLLDGGCVFHGDQAAR